MKLEPSPDDIERGAAAAPPTPSLAYSRYVLGVLFILYTVSYIDRQVMSVLLEPIKREMGVSDTAMGFLTGIAFAIFYVLMGIPIARWSDRGSRRNIISISVAAWSLMTAATGLATTYAHLLVARVGVGIGEAGGGAPSHSLISDYFPPERRATALGILTTGGGFGITLGLLLGGWLGDLYGWRTAFLVLGLPGVLIALLVRFTVREPVRGGFDSAAVREHATTSRDSVTDVVRFMWQKRSFRYLSLAATLHVFAGFGASNWNPAFLMRVHGMSGTEVGMWLGPIAGACAGAGAIFWGMLTDRLGRGDERWYMWVPAVGSLCAMPFAYAFILIPDKTTALLFLIPSAFIGNCYTGATFAMTQGLARPHMRTLAAAIILFVMNLLGLGLGPFVLGVMNDVLEPRFGLLAIRYSLLLIALPHLLAAVFNVLAARTLRADLSASRAVGGE